MSTAGSRIVREHLLLGAGRLKRTQRALTMGPILLAAQDWQVRALLRAQLLEDGFEVEAHATVASALEGLEARKAPPSLIVADISSSDEPVSDLDQLAQWSGRIPVWILARRSLTDEKALGGHGFEVIKFRPIDLGRLIEEIEQRVRS